MWNDRVWPRRLLAVLLAVETVYVAAVGYVLVDFGRGMAAFDGEPVYPAAVALRLAAVLAVVGAMTVAASGLWAGWHRESDRPRGRCVRAALLLLVLGHAAAIAAGFAAG